MMHIDRINNGTQKGETEKDGLSLGISRTALLLR